MISKLWFGDALPTWALFAEFAVAGLVVILAGSRFARQADAIADRLNLGSGWVGLILLATVTSLPELITGGTATALGNVDLALGGIFGSCCFNITIIVLLNALWGGGSVLRGVSPSHVLSSSFGLLMIGIALLGMVMMDKFSHRPSLARMGEWVWVVALAVTYLGCMRLLYRHERNHSNNLEQAGRRQEIGSSIMVQLVLAGVVIVGASWWLGNLGDVLSTHEIKLIGRPLGATFVGAFFLALATSLPEIATSVAAVRLGNLNLALGNIFGSNMFNIFVIPMLKLVSVAGGESRFLVPETFGNSQNLIAGLLAILLTAIAVGGLAYQSEHKIFRRFGFDSILIAVTYVGGMLLLLLDAR